MSAFKLCLGLYGIESFYGGDPRSLFPIVQQAEQLGFDQLVITDHVVMGGRLDRYPYGDFLTPPEYPWYEPITTLSVLAGLTDTIELSQGVLISPLRSAALLAKQAATLDVLSGGRVVLGLGSGWQREEYEASGLPFAGRKQKMFDQIAAMKNLWRDAPASFASESINFDSVYCRPAPINHDIPCWVGIKATPNNCDSIAACADGWIPIEQDPSLYKPRIERLKQAFEKAGRNPAALSVRAQVQPQVDSSGNMDLDATLETIPSMLEAGVTHIEILPIVFVQSAEQMDEFLEKSVATKKRYS